MSSAKVAARTAACSGQPVRRAVTSARFVFEVARAGVAASLLLSCRQTPPPVMPYDFGVGAEVVRAMYDRYLNRWPETLVLVQHNTPYGPAADSLAAIWLTAVQLPARLRIDYEPRESGNGVLLVRDTQYVVRGGRSGQGKPVLDPLLLLQHDVYF
ncbi:MAG TPA: hypothetical protein VK864_20710, partial [Longimicrobiales bacterium]|nr:hypothetical protein [Longimicrobiales bacterium]